MEVLIEFLDTSTGMGSRACKRQRGARYGFQLIPQT
jgi:hypothetical protein